MANYYMKFNQDFFDTPEIKLLESLENGESLVLFYLKLATKAIANNGYLILNENVKFDNKMLSLLFRKDIDFVNNAIDNYIAFGLITIDDNILYMAHISKFIGKKDNSADRVKKYREKQKSLQNVTVTKCNALQNVTCNDSNKKCNTYIKSKNKSKNKSNSKDIELKKELKLKKKQEKEKQALLKKDAEDIYNYYRINIKSGLRKKAIDNLSKILKDYSKDDLLIAIQNYKITMMEIEKRELKFIKSPENFFSIANEVYKDYLGYNLQAKKDFISEIENIDRRKDVKVLKLELKNIRDKYIKFLEDDDISKAWDILNNGFDDDLPF